MMRLRNPVLLAALAAAVLTAPACVSKKKFEESQAENQRLTKEREDLKAEVASVGAANTEAQATLDEVQKGLVELRAKELKAIQTSITVAREGKASGRREELKAELEEIRAAVRANLAKLATLEKRSQAAEARATTLERLVSELKSQLEEKETTISQLEEKVLQLQQATEELKTTVASQETQITEQKGQLATAYVLSGTKKELLKTGLVEKKGSILGLGGNWQRTGKFDETLFRKIDTREEKEFPFTAPPDKVRILSDHPKDSYEVVAEDPKGSRLKITDPDRFWKGSKFLVILLPD